MRVMQPFLRKSYNNNPKGSSTVEVTMADALPFNRIVRVTHTGNVPMNVPINTLRGPRMPIVAHSRDRRLPFTPGVRADVSGLGAPYDMGPPAPTTTPKASGSWMDTISSAGKTLVTGGAQRAADEIARKKRNRAAAPMPSGGGGRGPAGPNWTLVGGLGIVALVGVFMLSRRGGSRRR